MMEIIFDTMQAALHAAARIQDRMELPVRPEPVLREEGFARICSGYTLVYDIERPKSVGACVWCAAPALVKEGSLCRHCYGAFEGERCSGLR